MSALSVGKMKWTLLVMVILLLTSSFLTGCSQEKTIKIGFVAQMTGPDSYIGQSAKPALEDRIAEINAKGGIKGYKLELITYDSRSEVPDAVASAKRLIDQDKVVGIIGPEWSAAAIPLAPIAEAAKISIITTTASNTLVTIDETGKLNPYMFRVCFIDPYQGYALADFAYKEQGKRKVAFITDVSSPYSVGIEKFFIQHFTELGGQVVAQEGYQANDTEYRAQLAKIVPMAPDLVMVPTATYRDIALISQQATALGFKTQFMGGDGWVSDELLTMAGKDLEGAIVSSGISETMPEFEKFNTDFFTKHNIKANVYAYYALDALYALEYGIGTAIDQKGSADTTAIRDAIANMKDVQAFTSKLTMEPDTHNPHNKPVVLMQITNSEWKIIKTYAP